MSGRRDLFGAARDNANRLERDFAREAALNPILVRKADEIQEKARVSINRRFDAIIDLLSHKGLPSGYHYAEKLAEELGWQMPEDFPECLVLLWTRSTPKHFIRRRTEFLRAFEHGEKHLFGALNGGGPGAAAKNAAYGEYCIVFKKDAFDALPDAAYCKHDTLNHDAYWKCPYGDGKCLGSGRDGTCPVRKKNAQDERHEDFKCEIDFDVLIADYAPHSHRGRLAAIEYKDEILRDPNWSIADVIQPSRKTTERYIEVAFILDVTIDHIESVRCHRELIRCIFEEICIDDNALGSTASVLEYHRRVCQLLDQHGIDHDSPFKTGSTHVQQTLATSGND